VVHSFVLNRSKCAATIAGIEPRLRLYAGFKVASNLVEQSNHVGHIIGSIIGRLRQHRVNNLRKPGDAGSIREAITDPRRRFLEVLSEHRQRIARNKRGSPDYRMIKSSSEAVDIGPLVDIAPANLLRARTERRANESLGEVHLVTCPDNSEIEQVGEVPSIGQTFDHDVLRFHILGAAPLGLIILFARR
jgi:hypothetical protein